jgi:hypothetical protein
MIIILGDRDLEIGGGKRVEDMDSSLGRICGGNKPTFLASYIIYSGSQKPGSVYYFKARNGLTGWQPESTVEQIEVNPEYSL